MGASRIWVIAAVAVLACGKKPRDAARGGAGSASAPSAGSATGSAAIGSAGASTASVAATAAGPGSAAARDPGVTAIDPEPRPVDAEHLGANIALAALGGRVVSPADPADAPPEWRTGNLLDGYPIIRGIADVPSSLGWAWPTGDGAHELVLGFHGASPATIAAVAIDTTTDHTLATSDAIPSGIEIWASPTSATDGFAKIATVTPASAAGETIATFAPTPAAFVKLVVTGTYGAGATPELGEIAVYEAAGARSIVADLPRNLLLPALGGSVVRFTSQAADAPIAELVDDKVGVEAMGWTSAPVAVDAKPVLPQEITFAFRDHRAAYIDHLVIDPTSGMRYYHGPIPNTSTWPKTIEIQTSNDTPFSGFSTAKVIEVPPVAKPVTIAMGARIRFLRLRITENNGGEYTTLGEVAAYEGVAPGGGASILAGRSPVLERLGVVPETAGTEAAARREREPNNTQKEADLVEAPTPIGGAVVPPGSDRDVFRVPSARGPGTQTLTVALEGRPTIRTRVHVIDGAGRNRYELDPARLSGPTATFSVVTEAGDLFVQVSQPATAQVVIWDTSGSMERRVADLDAALRDYLAGVEPADRVQLVRFDDSVEVLLPDFSGDRAALVGALKDKVYAFGGTSIYDAVGKGLDALDQAAGTRAIVLMTDGEDTTSALDPSAFWRALDAGRVRLYAIGLGNGLRNYSVRAGATAEWVLANAAAATGGRYTFVRDSARLSSLYAQIRGELHAPATYAIAARTATGTGTVRVAAAGDRLAVPPRVELVLDASGSMKRAAGAGTMMDAAKAALIDLIGRLPASATVGLRVYGHRVPERRSGACEDTELVAPFAPLDRKALVATIKRVRPLGTTPIAFAVAAAGEDLKDATGSTLLIVVTDGREECGGDPVAAVAALRAGGLAVTVNVVGFSLTDPADREAMTKVAAAGGGRFLDAQGATGLRAAIDDAMAVPFTIVDATGAELARGVVGGEPVAAPAGDLTVRIDAATTPIVVDHVIVEAGKPTAVTLTKDGNGVSARIGAPGSTP